MKNLVNCWKIQNGQSAAKPGDVTGRFRDYSERKYIQVNGSARQPILLVEDIVQSL
jgi:hypothetical protein